MTMNVLSSTMRLLVVVGALAMGAPLGCEIPQGKVGQGQLYLSGEARYDAYFRDVHNIQVWAAEWPDDRKATRRPLLSILDLTPDAADVTIIQATHEKMSNLSRDGGGTKLDTFVEDAKVTVTGSAHSDQGLFRAIEETASGELQRAKKLNMMLPKMDELAKVGRSLEPHVSETFQKQTPGKVTEVRQELSASLNVLGTINSGARRAMRECDDFVSDLQRAVATGTEAGHYDRIERTEDRDKDAKDKPDTKSDKPKGDKATDKPKKKPEAPPPPKPTPVAKKDETPKPASPPPPKPAKPPEGEVFNP